MEHSVRLERLPTKLVFPAELADRIHYEAAQKRLVFRGVMDRIDYDRLVGISDDVSYLNAIQQLYCQATYPPPAKRSWFALRRST